MLLPHPISYKNFPWDTYLAYKIVPAKVARFDIYGGTPLAVDVRFGRSGSAIDHAWLFTSFLGMFFTLC